MLHTHVSGRYNRYRKPDMNHALPDSGRDMTDRCAAYCVGGCADERSAPARATYSCPRAGAETDGGLRVAASVPAVRGRRGSDGCRGGVRRRPVPAARRGVPRPTQRRDLPDLPQGTAHVGLVGVRRPPRYGERLRPVHRRDHAARRRQRGVHRPRGGGVPQLSLEPSGPVVRRRTGAPTAAATITSRRGQCRLTPDSGSDDENGVGER